MFHSQVTDIWSEQNMNTVNVMFWVTVNWKSPFTIKLLRNPMHQKYNSASWMYEISCEFDSLWFKDHSNEFWQFWQNVDHFIICVHNQLNIPLKVPHLLALGHKLYSLNLIIQVLHENEILHVHDLIAMSSNKTTTQN